MVPPMDTADLCQTQGPKVNEAPAEDDLRGTVVSLTQSRQVVHSIEPQPTVPSPRESVVDDASFKPNTYSIPEAGKMAGLARNASYAAANRGQIPLIRFGGKRRVPGAKWRRMLAEGTDR